ncbi:MAG: MFS transporter [Burkholderiaceae bacterium]|nr:MFS transporter [Burkholderiaceae bacterium]
MQTPVCADARAPAAPIAFGFVVIATSLSFFMTQLDVTIVNVALPRMAQDLSASVGALQWVVDAYTLAFAATMLCAGALGDRLGTRRALQLGIVVFGAASLVCAVAPSAQALDLARALQGIGAAAMLPNSLALLNHSFSHDAARRAKAVGWWTASGAISLTMGPVVGGALVAALGWRWIFLVNLPICAFGLGLAARLPQGYPGHELKGFDAAGQLWATAGLTLLTAAIIECGQLGPTPFVWACFAAAVACGVLFALAERHASHPVLPRSLFAGAAVLPAVGFGMVMNFTYYGFIFVLSIFLQQVLHYSPLQAGFAFLPLTAGFFLSNIVSGPIVARFGSRLPMLIGAVIDAAGFALLLTVDRNSHYGDIAWGFLLIPMGMGLGVPAMTTAVLSSTEKRLSATASAVLNTARQASGAFGVAILGAWAHGGADGVAHSIRAAALLCIVMLAAAFALALRLDRPISGFDRARQ